MPIRKIPRNGRSITGRVATYNGSGSVEHESLLERDAFLILDFDPDAASIDSQPRRIEYLGANAQGKPCTRTYIPDFLVQYSPASGRPPLLVEVKYAEQLRADREVLMPKIRAGIAYAHAQGWRFRVLTERRLRGALLDNVRFLRPYRREPRDERDCALLLTLLTRMERCTVDDLLAACEREHSRERGLLLPSLWRLLAAHEAGAELRAQPLSFKTLLWPLYPAQGQYRTGVVPRPGRKEDAK